MTDTNPLPRDLPLRDKLAQLMFVRIGSNLPPVRAVEDDAERIEQLLGECAVGGLLLFNGRAHQTPQTLERLQNASRFPLLVAADIERGIGQQLHGETVFPHAMAFDALGVDAAAAVEQFAYLTGRAARRCGIQIAFAPVADVNIDPRNPIIATRAFGTDPERVAELVSSYIRGSQRAGMLTAAKHFPGHGNTHDDSHHALPIVSTSREELHACELVPFQAAIAAEVPLIMTAHVRYDALDASGMPATLSRQILNDLLRNELHYQGAVVSDSLLMEGVKQNFADEGELAVAVLEAGVDILLDVAEPVATLDALERAVQAGRLDAARVDESFARVGHLKALAALPVGAFGQSGPYAADAFAADVAASAVTCLGDTSGLLPLAAEKSLCAVLVKPFTTAFDPPEQVLAEALRNDFRDVAYFEFGPDFDADLSRKALAAAATREQLLVAIIVKPAAWHQFGLLEHQNDLVEQLCQQENCVLVSLGSPEGLHRFPGAPARLTTYSDVPVSQVALAKVLLRSQE